MFPTSLPGGRPDGMTAARPTSAFAASAASRGMPRRLERRAIAELGQGDVGTTIGNEDDVLHRARIIRGAPVRDPERP